MSNLAQFYGAGFPIGSTISTFYNGDIITTPDGTKWMTPTPTSPFAYTSDYAALPESMTSPHALLPGFSDGLFRFSTTSPPTIAFNSSSGLYCTQATFGISSAGYSYYTSSDGVNWTLRTFPTTSPAQLYSFIVYIAGKFIAVASSATTNAVAYSTDAISWTLANITNLLATPVDIISNGANNLIMIGANTATANYSTNGGTSWTGVSLGASAANNSAAPGAGAGTWAPSAGLFIILSNVSGAYMTSPDAVTWTSRNAIASSLIYGSFLGSNAQIRVAASSSIIVMMGNNGFYLTSTDGLTWTPNIISNVTSSVLLNLYHDGTRFVAKYGASIYYSTNGTTWTKGKPVFGATNFPSPQSSGTMFAFTNFANAGSPVKCLKVSDVTLTTPQTVGLPIANSVQSGVNGVVSYYRIA